MVLLCAVCACAQGQPPLVWASVVTSRLYLCSAWVTTSVPSPRTLARETQGCVGVGILEERGCYHRRGSPPLKDGIEPREQRARAQPAREVHCDSSACLPDLWCSHPNCWLLTLSRCATLQITLTEGWAVSNPQSACVLPPSPLRRARAVPQREDVLGGRRGR